MLGLFRRDLDVGQPDMPEAREQIVPLHPVGVIVDAAPVAAVGQVAVVLQPEEIAGESVQADAGDPK